MGHPKESSYGERIVNGDSIGILQTPWQIALLLDSKLNCGGSILSSRIILTAAHCLKGYLLETLSVRAGSRYWNHDGQFLLVENFTIHENYNSTTLNNDIGVIRLAKSLVFNSRVQPIALAQESPKHGDFAYVSGWGSLEFEAIVGPVRLNGLETSIMDREACAVFYFYLVSDNMICTYTPNKGVYKGDSGGPLVANGRLVGVVSWSAGRNKPSGYANVAYFYNWIQAAIDDLENRQAGSRYWNHDGQFLLVENFTIHENYNRNTSNNDIGLIRLAQPLVFSTKVRPIVLAQESPKHGDFAYVSGWGRIEYEGYVPTERLHNVDTSILDREACAVIYYTFDLTVSDNMICTYSTDKGAFKGDSGGPLVVNGRLAGIVSWGKGRNTPAVYANVAYFYKWIQKAIED
ncbi:hypothetical protein KR222_000247, partial [Zaprionus bogoriensis]